MTGAADGEGETGRREAGPPPVPSREATATAGPAATATRRARALLRRASDPSVALLLSQVVAAGAAFLFNMLAARGMSADGRGQIALMLQLAYVASNLLLLGTQISFVAVHHGSTPAGATRAYLRLMRLPLALAGGLTVALLVAGTVLSGEWRVTLLLVAGFTVTNMLVVGLRVVSIAARRQTEFLVYMVVSQALLVGGLVLVFLGDVTDSRVWMLVYVATVSLPTVAVAFRWARLRRDGEGEPSAEEQGPLDRRARHEGLVLFPATLAHMGMLRADRLVLPVLASTSALGLYATIGTMTELLAWPLKAYADTRLGHWRARHREGRLGLVRVLAGATAFVAVAGLAYGLLCALLIVPLFGERYASATPLVLPLVLAAAVYGLSRLTLAALVAQERNGVASLSEVLGFGVSLPAYVVMIPESGALGAAYASLLGYWACLVFSGGVLLFTRGAGAPGARDGWRGPDARPPRTAAWRPSLTRLTRLTRRTRLARPPWPSPAPRPVVVTAEGEVRGDPVTAAARAGVRWAPTLALLLFVLGGRYTLERAGLNAPAWLLDLRFLGLVVVLGTVVYDLRRPRVTRADRPAAEGWLVATLLFFGFQLGSALWAPDEARVGETALDLLLLAAVVVAFYLHAREDPTAVVRRTLWFFYVASVVFGLVALLVTGPGAQGRYAALGGGPNVFVRIESLGIICAVALVALGASRALLWALPLLVLGAVLSGSRGGLLALVLVGLGLALSTRGRARRLVLGGFAGAACVVAVSYVFSLGSGLIQSRFVEQTLRDGYSSDRFGIWRDTLELAVESPLGGAGLDGYYGLVGRHVGLDYPHNYVLAVLGESGLVGLTLLGVAVLLWMGRVRALVPLRVETRACVVAAAYVALASAFSGDYYDTRLVWVFAALAASFPLSATAPLRHREDAPERVRPEPVA